MQRIILLVVAVLVIVLLLGLWAARSPADSPQQQQLAQHTVEQFGAQLKNVSLLAPTSTVIAAMEQNYKPYVTNALLSAWERDPQSAPGRMTSSPAPDRIEVNEITRSNSSYVVAGNIIETASAGPAISVGVTLTLDYSGGAWKISKFSGGPAR